MKKNVFSLCLLLVFSYGNSQEDTIPYYDAKFIRENCFDEVDGLFNNATSLIPVLQKYYPGIAFVSPLNADQVALIKANPFFGDFMPDGGQLTAGVRQENKFSITSLAGLDVTNIANGISQFMIKRAKEELTIAFFNRFKQFASENQEFEVLFPQTTQNLENLLAFKYPEMLPALRTGFFEDIQVITYHLDDVLMLPRYQALLKDLPEVKAAVRTVRLLFELEAGYSQPADIFAKFASFEEWDEASSSDGFRNFGNSVKLAEIFSRSLRNDTSLSQSPRAWIAYKQLDSLVSDDIAFRLYLGLLYQSVKNESISFYVQHGDNPEQVIRFDDLMADQADNLFLFRNKVIEFAALANRIDRLVDTIKSNNFRPTGTVPDSWYDYMDVSLDLLDYGLSIGKLFHEDIDLEEFANIARSANELYRNLYKQEYTQVISHVVDILQATKALIDESQSLTADDITLLKSSDLNISISKRKGIRDVNKKAIAKINNYINEGSLGGDTLERLERIQSLAALHQLDQKLLKITEYGLFIANMAEAESPEQVSAILDNVTLPVGSSSIKKNSKFNVSIQSYLGAFASLEGSAGYPNAWNSAFGVIAPIGIAFSLGLPDRWGSVSLFGSLLDLGAIVDYQLANETIPSSGGGDSTVVYKDYKVELGQIFSPGGYVVYGLPWNLPLALGVGGQFGPGLGKIEFDGSTVVNNPEWRWNIFLAVDIPFFNIAQTPKRYKIE